MCKAFSKLQDSTQKAIDNIIKSVPGIESEGPMADTSANAHAENVEAGMQ